MSATAGHNGREVPVDLIGAFDQALERLERELRRLPDPVTMARSVLGSDTIACWECKGRAAILNEDGEPVVCPECEGEGCFPVPDVSVPYMAGDFGAVATAAGSVRHTHAPRRVYGEAVRRAA